MLVLMLDRSVRSESLDQDDVYFILFAEGNIFV